MVVLVIFASFVLVTQGKADETGSWVGNIMAKLGFGCKDIGTVKFDGFMAAIKEVHEGCKYKDECNIKSCQEMTLEIPAPDTCYKVDKKVLLAHDLGELVMPSTPTIFCEEEYGGAKDHLHVYCTPLNCNQDQCKQQDYFSVANNAKIKITSKKKGWIWKSIPVKVEIDEGDDYSGCVEGPISSTVQCRIDGGEERGYCYIANNKWCDNDVFNPNYYCAKCADKDSTNCFEDTVKCDGTSPYECTAPTSDITCTGLADLVVKVVRLKPEATEPEFAMISAHVSGVPVDQGGGSPNIELPIDQEVCFDEAGHSIGASSPDCKMVLYLEEITKTGSLYEVKIIKGCY